MANQPTKYSKFLVGAASAALVASAVAPVASAADFKDTKGNTHEEAINALSDAGIIKGYTDGSFQPNKTLTRSDVVKMMGKWLVTEGASIPEDARTNPRFSDLTTKSNGELLDYAAVVKDAGVFIGSNGKLLAGDNITRENMALVLVRAFDKVNEIDLVTYVNGQDFKADVKDLNAAKTEAQAAINVLDFFDITNPTVANFNPKGNTTRGHFATFLHKSINTDFSKVTGAVSGAVKAVNATTVEVTFKEDVKDVKTSDYTIEGLAISNAAVKQTDSKVVVLTTAAQTGDKEYTLKSGESTIGTFKGISAVIPTKITMNTASTQGVVGKEVTLKADIGVKEAGVPVTFNVAAGSKLNKDHIEEVVTDANGIATYSYTQYVAGEKDDVVAYPTGAPAVRSIATVYWGVDAILTVTEQDDKQGSNVANGANKVYKVTYKNSKTGVAVANQKMHVTFVENVGVTIDKTSKATINGTNPMQLSNGTAPVTAEVVTDSNGVATFTVSGHNTTVTPVVYPNEVVVSNNNNNTTTSTDVKTWDATKLQAQAAKVVFGATQADYVIDVTRDGGEEAAIGAENGRKYKVVLKTKDGKVAANEIVNVAFNEDIDRNINTVTKAYFTDDDKKVLDSANKVSSQITVKTNDKGEASFTISSDEQKDYASPIVWLDINTSNAKDGNFDEGEPFKIAPISYFAEAKLTGGTVKAYNLDAKTEKEKEKALTEFTGMETATFMFTAANQSGKKMDLPTGYQKIEATFTVFNTGANEIRVDGHIVSPNRSYTTTKITGLTPQIQVVSVNDKTTSVRVVANGTAVSNNTTDRTINLGSHTVEKVDFVSTKTIGSEYVGVVTKFSKTDKEITFDASEKVSYKGKNVSFFDESGVGSKTLTETEFYNLLGETGKLAEVRLLINGDNYKFVFMKHVVKGSDFTTSTTVPAQAYDTNGDGKADVVELTFDKSVRANILSSGDFKFTGGSVTATNIKVVDGTNDKKVKISISGASDLNVPSLTYPKILSLGTDYSDLVGDTITVKPAGEALLPRAKAAVLKAEKEQTQANVNAAQALVLELPLGADKTDLQTRLDKVQDLINSGNTEVAVKAAKEAVEKAEDSKQQADVTSAKLLVDNLASSTIKTTLLSRLTVVQDIIDGVATASLTAAITTAQAAFDGATEGVTVGNSIVGSKATLQTAIVAATTVKDNATSTVAQLDAAKVALDAAVTTFNAAKVVALTGLNDVTIAGTASDSANVVTLAAGETLAVATSDATKASVSVDTLSTVKVTGVAAGTSTITVEVKNAAGNVIKTGTFVVTTS